MPIDTATKRLQVRPRAQARAVRWSLLLAVAVVAAMMLLPAIAYAVPSGSSGTATVTLNPAVVRFGAVSWIRARFLDGSGNPIVGEPVTFSCDTGYFPTAAGVTDSTGWASAIYAPPAARGTFLVRAAIESMSVDQYLRVTAWTKADSLVRFAPYSSRLTTAAKRTLHDVAWRIYVTDVRSLRVAGHTARREPGNSTYRSRLSLSRAQVVRRYLLSELAGYKYKVLPSIRLSWYGATHPVASNATRRGTAANRRAEIYLDELMLER